MQFHNSFWLCSCLVSDISESVSGIIMMTQRLRSLLLFQRLYGWIFHRVAGDVIRNDPSNYRSGPCSTECHRLTDRTTGTWYLCRRSPPMHTLGESSRESVQANDRWPCNGHIKDDRRSVTPAGRHQSRRHATRTKRRPPEVSAIEWLDAICDATGARLLQPAAQATIFSRCPVERGRGHVTQCRQCVTSYVTSFTLEGSATNR